MAPQRLQNGAGHECAQHSTFEFSNEVKQGEQRPGFTNKVMVKTATFTVGAIAVGERHRRRYMTSSVSGVTHTVVNRRLNQLPARGVPKSKKGRVRELGQAGLHGRI